MCDSKDQDFVFCSSCVFPMGLRVNNPATGKPLDFEMRAGQPLCECCAAVHDLGLANIRETCDREFQEFLGSTRSVLFAYSGGLDSTIVLALMRDECRKRGIKLDVFTVATGVKGNVADKNVRDVISNLGLGEAHLTVDITHAIQDDPAVIAITGKTLDTFDVYRHCHATRTLPCGKLCNRMIDRAYLETMRATGYETLMTGGDTPKQKQDGNFSIHWKKPSGITIVRGGFAFGLSKTRNRNLVSELNLPWADPLCGGYDTDCLMPGAYFADLTQGRKRLPLEEVIEKCPVVLEYLAERVRFGIIDRTAGLDALTRLDVPAEDALLEYGRLFTETTK